MHIRYAHWVLRTVAWALMVALLLHLGKAVAADLPYRSCFEGAGAKYQIDVDLLQAIGWHESRYKQDARNTANVTDSEDMGVMQINSWWLPKLETYGITRELLFADACVNIYVGAWILAQEIQRHGDLWTAVGYYNAKTESKRLAYTEYVKTALAEVQSGAAGKRYAAAQARAAGIKPKYWEVVESRNPSTRASAPPRILVVGG